VADAAAPMAETRTLILDAAARSRLLADGHAGLSTRKVAEEAGVPLSQLHYHFGSKQGLVLALFEEENCCCSASTGRCCRSARHCDASAR
jgi:AcrR family transcriptional regulator